MIMEKIFFTVVALVAPAVMSCSSFYGVESGRVEVRNVY
jgi:hypothetical protein